MNSYDFEDKQEKEVPKGFQALQERISNMTPEEKFLFYDKRTKKGNQTRAIRKKEKKAMDTTVELAKRMWGETVIDLNGYRGTIIELAVAGAGADLAANPSLKKIKEAMQIMGEMKDDNKMNTQVNIVVTGGNFEDFSR